MKLRITSNLYDLQFTYLHETDNPEAVKKFVNQLNEQISIRSFYFDCIEVEEVNEKKYKK